MRLFATIGGMQIRTISLISLLAMAALLPLAQSSADDEDPEIEYLLEAIGDSGCVFVRNGSEHDAEKAEDHLRMKYRRGRRYATSAETFIERLASKSSMTKKLYMMQCPGKEAQPTGEWLKQRLAAFRQKQS